MSVDLPPRPVDPNELYVDYMRALVEYLQKPDVKNLRLVCTEAEKADQATGGYWSDHGPQQDDLACRLDRLLAGHPDEWNLLVNSLTGVPEDLAAQLRQLAPSDLRPLSSEASKRYAKVVHHLRCRAR